MKIKLPIIITAILCIFLNQFSQIVYADEISDRIDAQIHEIEEAQFGDDVQQWIDTYLLENMESCSLDWYVFAFLLNGSCVIPNAYQTKLQEMVRSETSLAAVTRQKCCLILLLLSPTEYRDLAADVMEQTVSKQGVMSVIWGLHLANQGISTENWNQSKITEMLLNQQCDDGGWSVQGKKGDVDVTSMALQSLAAQQNDSENVASAIERGIQFLSDCQTESGGFRSYGVENAESAAQVLMALSLLQIDSSTNALFTKNGHTLFDSLSSFEVSDGAYSHEHGGEPDTLASSQIYLAYACFLHRDRFEIRNEGSDSDDNSNPASSQTSDVVSSQKLTGDTTSAQMAGDLEDNASELHDAHVAPLICMCLLNLGCIVLFFLLHRCRKPKMRMVFIVFTLFLLALLSLKIYKYFDALHENKSVVGTVSLTISCDALSEENLVQMNFRDAIILEMDDIPIHSEDTVLDVLRDAVQQNKLQIEIDGIGKSAYVRGISNLYEFDFGECSGWIYTVNDISPNVGVGAYSLTAGDQIRFEYIVDLGQLDKTP